jgi:hypothetical protein
MRPRIQPCYTAIMQVAPPDLENLYLCAVLSCTDVGVPLCTAADVGTDTSLLIYSNDAETARRLGVDDRVFNDSKDGDVLIFRSSWTCLSRLNVLLPKGCSKAWRCLIIEQHMDRLDTDEYIWCQFESSFDVGTDKFVIKGYIRAH